MGSTRIKGMERDGAQMDEEAQAISGALLKAIFAEAPRKLMKLQGELLFFDGQALFHYRDDADPKDKRKGARDQFKFVTMGSLKAAFAGAAYGLRLASP